MGFYDQKIKALYEKCPRLVILSINSIFHKEHCPEEKLIYLDKEQNGENESYMDMLLSVENCKYHLEFQLLEGNMAIRMYEYSVKEAIRDLAHDSNQAEENEEIKQHKYEIDLVMPAQAVIFLAGVNKQDTVKVHLTLPDGKKVDYSLPCISASVPVEDLIKDNLFILIPFQQVQLNSRMNDIKKRKGKTKLKIAHEMYYYHREVKTWLEKLYAGGIIKENEFDNLIEVLSDIENYLIEKDDKVKEEVIAMGDKDYVCWSERKRQEGRIEGRQEGEIIYLTKMICNKKNKGLDVQEIAELCEEDKDVVSAIYEIADKYAPDYDIEAISKEYWGKVKSQTEKCAGEKE